MISPLNQSPLVDLFRHNTWANLTLSDFCHGLTDEDLDKPGPVGTYGSIRATLIHTLGGQALYLAIGNGRPRDVDEPFSGVPVGEAWWQVFQARIKETSESLETLAASLPPESTIEWRDGDESWRVSASFVFLQALNHATEHRSQISTAITQLGVEPPTLDGWTFGDEYGLLTLTP